MIDLSGDAFLWVKAVHIIAAIAWMAGLFYLPRLFIYHTEVAPGSEASEKYKVMERRLLRAIMHPAGVLTLVLGGVLVLNLGDLSEGWVHAKLLAVAGLVVMHGLMAHWRAAFRDDKNTRSGKFYRVMNEVPTVLMVVIVIMAVVRPF